MDRTRGVGSPDGPVEEPATGNKPHQAAPLRSLPRRAWREGGETEGSRCQHKSWQSRVASPSHVMKRVRDGRSVHRSIDRCELVSLPLFFTSVIRDISKAFSIAVVVAPSWYVFVIFLR